METNVSNNSLSLSYALTATLQIKQSATTIFAAGKFAANLNDFAVRTLLLLTVSKFYRKTFSKFYRRYYELISKYNVGLKTLLSEGLSEPEFYGDLVYKFKKLIGSNDFSFQFRKIIKRYKRIGYNLNVMRQSACLVFNPITVDNYAAFFNCTPVGRASDSMMAPTQSYSF